MERSRSILLEFTYLILFFRDPCTLDLNNVFGFILNVPTDYRLGFVLLPIKRRHWVAIREINGFFYNLDSKLDSPQLIGKVSIYRFQKLCLHFK